LFLPLRNYEKDILRPTTARRARLRRAIGRIVVSILLLLCSVFIFLFYVPVNLPWLNSHLLQKMQWTEGIRLTFESAHVLIGQGLYKVENLTFYRETGNEEPLLTVRELDVTARPLSLIFGRSGAISKVEIHAPSELDLSYGKSGVALGPKSSFLRQALSHAANRANHNTGIIPVDSLAVSDATVTFIEQETSGTSNNILPGMGGRNVRISGLNLSATRQGELGAQADFSGILYAGGKSSSIEGSITAPDRESADVSVACPSITIGRLFSEGPAATVAAEQVAATMHISRQKSDYHGNGEITAARLDINSPAQKHSIADSEIKVAIQAELSPRTAVLKIGKLIAQSNSLQAEASGETHLVSPNPFKVHVISDRVGSVYQDLIKSLLPDGYALSSEDGSFTLDTTVSGNHFGVTSLVGTLGFTSTTLTTAHLARPVKDFSGELNFEPDRVVLHNIHALVGKTGINMDGALNGNYLRDRQGTLHLTWKAAANTDDLLSLLNPSIGSKGSAGQGHLSSEGEFEQTLSLRGFSETTSPARISGSVHITDAGFHYAALPAPVRNLTGDLRIHNNIVEVDSLQGRMEGNNVRISGKIEGNDYFWRDPVLSATVATHLNLREITNYLPPNLRDSAARYRIEGEANTNIRISADLRHIGNVAFTGKIETTNLSFDPNLNFMTGQVSEANAVLDWNGDQLRLERFFGRINGQPVEASGLISPNEISLGLKSRFDAKAVPDTFPKLQKWMQMDGPASADVQFSVLDSGAPGAIPAVQNGFGGRLVPLMSLVTSRLNEAVANRNYRLDGKVELGDSTRGARIRHNAMPPARVDEHGKKIPEADLNNIHGVATLAGDTIRVENPMHCSFADTPNCEFTGSLQYRPGNLPKLDFDVNINGEARLDPWIIGWGKALIRPDTPPVGTRHFELTGIVHAKRLYYRGQRTGASRTNISFDLDENAGVPRRTEFRNLRIAELNSPGYLSGSGQIESYPWDKSGRYPQWQCSTSIFQMQMLPLLSVVFRDVQTLNGIISTQLELRGSGKNVNNITGGGTATITNAAISETAVIQKLGQTTSQSFRQLFQTARAAQFHIDNGAISTPNLQLQTKGVLLEMRGSYFFDKHIDAYMRVGLFESILGQIPLLGDLANLADRIAGQLLLAFHVTGPAANPRVQPIPLPLLQGFDQITGNP
jgi:hypothetical protein